jgi:hypothetical protein
VAANYEQLMKMDLSNNNNNMLEKNHYQDILRVERQNRIIGRYHSISMEQTLEIKNVKSIIFASWFIYLKYQMVNNRMLNNEDINRIYPEVTWK